MGKSTNQKNDAFAFKPEYNQQISGAPPPVGKEDVGGNDPFAFRPEYNTDVKKKVGGTASETGITDPSPTQSELQSKKETATDFLVKDIGQNDFFSKLSNFSDQQVPHTTPQRVNQQAAEMTQREVLRNPASLQRYVGDRIKDLREDLKNIERDKTNYVQWSSAGTGAVPTMTVVNKKQYDQLAQTAREKQDYINKLKSNAAEIASDLILSQMDLSTGVDLGTVGRQITSLADPEQESILKMAEKGGNVLPGIKREAINQVGLQAVKGFLARNPNLPNYDQVVKAVSDQEANFDQQNPQTAALRVKEKIGAQLYKEGKGSFFGFGYSANTLKDAADNPVTGLTPSEKKIFNEVVLPTERRLIGTEIPTSGFTKSFYNAIEKGARGMGKTIGDVTGLRDESDQAADLLSQEVEGSRYRAPGESPSAQAQLSFLQQKEKIGKLSPEEQTLKKDIENYTYVRNGWSKFKDGVGDLTGQVAMIALTTKGLGAVGRSLVASGAEGGLLGGLTRSTVGQAISNETVGLFVSSYLNAFDNYKQQAIQLMPGEEKAANRSAYATVMSSVEALSERIFRDTKILNAFTKGVAPTIREITNQFINKGITREVAREETQAALSKAFKTFGKEYLASTGQEATEEAVVDIAQGIADSVFGGQPFDIVKTGQQALNTFLTTALYSPIVAGMAGAGAVRRQNAQNSFIKSALVDMAANPTQYLQSVEELQLDGAISQQEANEKIKLIQSASNYLKEIPPARTVTTKTGEGETAQTVQEEKQFDYPETSSYLLHRLNEGILNEQIENTTDEVLKSKLQRDLNRSQEIRKGIFDGTIGVTPDLKEVTNNEEQANELAIFDVNQVQQDELIGTPFEAVSQNVPRGTNESISETPDEGLQNTTSEKIQPERKRSVSIILPSEIRSPQTIALSPNNEEQIKEAEDFNKESLSILTQNEVQPTLQQSTIEGYAKSKGIWIDDLTKKYGKPDKTGMESDVWINPDNKTVTKSQSLFSYDNLQQKLESIELHNELFPEAPMKVKGFGKSGKVFKVIVEQPLVEGEPGKNITQEEIADYLAAKGFKQRREGNFYNEDTSLIDITPNNAIKTPSGKIMIFDSIAKRRNPQPVEQESAQSNQPTPDTKPENKVSSALRDFAKKIRDADITGSGGAAAQSDITRLPREIIAFAIDRVADAIDAGEAVAKAIQNGVDYIREQGHVMEDGSFERYTQDLIAGKKPRVRVTAESAPSARAQETNEEAPQQAAEENTRPSGETETNEQENIDEYKMTTSGEVGRFLSGETWDDVFGEKAEGDQSYLTQRLSDMLQDGKNMITIAQNRWGGDVMLYGKPLFQFIQNMSNDQQLSNKKAVLMATFLGELQEAKKRSPERFDAISQLEKAVFAYYQSYMNVRGKEIVAARLLRLYRDKYIADIYTDRILDKEQVAAKKQIQQAQAQKQVDDKTASEKVSPVTEEEKKTEDKAAKQRTAADNKKQSKKKKMTENEAQQRAADKLKQMEEKMGKEGRGGLIDRIKDAIKKLNCK